MWIVKNRHQPRSNPETCLNHTSQPCRALVRPLMRRYPKNSRGPMRTPMLLNLSGICNGRPRYVCWKYPRAFGCKKNPGADVTGKTTQIITPIKRGMTFNQLTKNQPQVFYQPTKNDRYIPSLLIWLLWICPFFFNFHLLEVIRNHPHL